MSNRKQLWLHLAVTLGVLGASHIANVMLGPEGSLHSHQDGNGSHGHSHLHPGPHRHDRAPRPARGTDDTPAEQPGPQDQDRGIQGQYVPVTGPAVARPVAVVHVEMPVENAGAVTTATVAWPRTDRIDSALSPRGPPA